MDFESEMFRQFSRTQGKVRFESNGKVDEKDYASANFINASGTVGYSKVEIDGKPDCIFVSRTAAGIVLTMPGEQTGAAPFPIEGYKALTSVMSGSPARAFYESHMQALSGETPLPDRDWLEKEVPLLPQRALDVTMKIFALVCDQMDKLMAGMGNAMGEMVEGMGKAMGEAMEGMGKAMGEIVQGAQAEGALPEAKAEAAPKKKTRPARKARPVRARKANPTAGRRKGPSGRKKKK
jgi:hypothetical protein